MIERHSISITIRTPKRPVRAAREAPREALAAADHHHSKDTMTANHNF
jgi:hypothetical protein